MPAGSIGRSAAAPGTGVVIAGTPATGRGAIAIPVENDDWLVIAGGYGTHRPTRDPDEFAAYLAALPDSGRRRRRRRARAGERHRGLPADVQPATPLRQDQELAGRALGGRRRGLRVQPGLRAGHHRGRPAGRCCCASRGGGRRLQRRLDQVADFCWSVATSEDLRHPTSVGEQNRMQRIVAAWSAELTKLAVAGRPPGVCDLRRGLSPDDSSRVRCSIRRCSSRSPGPGVRGRGQPAPRPAVLDRLRTAATRLRLASCTSSSSTTIKQCATP